MRPTAFLTLASTVIAMALLAMPAQAATASVATRLEAKGIKYQVDDDGDYKVTYSYKKESRTQLVFVSGRTEEVGGFQVLEIFSPAARIGEDGIGEAKAMELLKESRSNKIGSWEVAGDVLYFVIKLPEPIDASQLVSAMDIAAETADDMELSLSGDRDEL